MNSKHKYNKANNRLVVGFLKYVVGDRLVT